MNIPKSPSLQLLRRLHHQPLGFNDISISSENDWESESTIIHRHSVSGSSRTSRCSSVLSCALDWEEVDKEISLPNFIEYKTNEKPSWDFTDELQRFKTLSDEDEEEQQDETIMSEGNPDLELPRDAEEIAEEEAEDEEEQRKREAVEGGDEDEENSTPLNRYQRDLAKRIFVKNFSDSTSERLLWHFFSQFGKISRVHIVKDRLTRKCRRRAFVKFATVEDAKAVLALDPSKLVIAGRQMYVAAARESTRQPGKCTTHRKEFKQFESVGEDVVEPSCSSGEFNINSLPTEVLEHIFNFLSMKERIKIERVCKRWRYIGTQLPWKINSLHFRNVFSLFNVMTDMILKLILKRCGASLKSLDMSCSNSRLTYRALTIIGDNCPNLESLQLSRVPLTNVTMIGFTGKCNKLKEIIFRNDPSAGLGETGLWYLVKNCRDLEVLEIHENHRIKCLCFHIISRNLRRLVLNNCLKLSQKGLMKLERCSCLEELHLNRCCGITTLALDFLLKHTSSTLRQLSLNGEFPLVDFRSIPFHVMTNLEHLSLAENHSIDDAIVITITQHCRKLRYLDISDISAINAGFNHLKDCNLLENLNISYNRSVNDEIIISLTTLGALEILTIRGMEKVTDNAFSELSSHCQRLKQLDVSSCPEITDCTVQNFQSALQSRKEQELKIIGGGTLITQFIEEGSLIVRNSNLCPINLRPWKEYDFYFYDSDDLDALNPDDLDYLDDDFVEQLYLYEGRT